MTITIEVPDEAQNDVLNLALKAGMPVEQFCFLLLAIGCAYCQAQPENMEAAKKAFINPLSANQ